MVTVELMVPKIAQPADPAIQLCGPAVFAMVAQYYGKPIDQWEIANSFWPPNRVRDYGLAMEDLQRLAEDHGFMVEAREHFTFPELRERIRQGIPLIAVVNSYRVPGGAHYVVVRGYETKPHKIIINDPANLQRNDENYEDFQRRWAGIGREKYKTYNYALAIGKSEQPARWDEMLESLLKEYQ